MLVVERRRHGDDEDVGRLPAAVARAACRARHAPRDHDVEVGLDDVDLAAVDRVDDLLA